jgi:glycine/D-amino acid oxidase-like deaminating enzyme
MPNYINSVWSEAKPAPPHAPLDGNLMIDDAVVGGGITGITAALLLARAGRRVVVLEGRRIGKGETGKSTAHMTEAFDVPYHTLVTRFGADGARLAAAGQRDAIARVAAFCDELQIDCGFRRLPGYLYVERREDLGALDEEAAAASSLGLDVKRLPGAPLPFPTAGALRWNDQAAFHPRAYLAALADALAAAGGRIAEETQVVEIDDADLCRVITDRGTVLARNVIVAAHVPISNRIFLHSKLAAYRTYVLGVALPPGATDAAGGLFWDTGAPYHYIRNHVVDGRGTLIVGGEDHKVGDGGDTIARFDRLEAYVRHHFHRDAAATDHRWSGQIVQSADGLPYVGRNTLSGRVFVATGYGGNGTTLGTLAGDDAERSGARSREPLRRAARRHPPQAARLGPGGDRRERRLSEAPHHRSAAPGRRGRRRPRRHPARRGAGAVARRAADGRLPERERPAVGAVAGVHAPRLPGPLEHHRAELGLSLPRQPLRPAGPGAERPGGDRARRPPAAAGGARGGAGAAHHPLAGPADRGRLEPPARLPERGRRERD